MQPVLVSWYVLLPLQLIDNEIDTDMLELDSLNLQNGRFLVGQNWVH